MAACHVNCIGTCTNAIAFLDKVADSTPDSEMRPLLTTSFMSQVRDACGYFVCSVSVDPVSGLSEKVYGKAAITSMVNSIPSKLISHNSL